MIEACELSPEEARAQADRYRELGRRVEEERLAPALDPLEAALGGSPNSGR